MARPEDKLNTLVDLAVGSDSPIRIEAEGRTVGVVTRRALLRGIQGREEVGTSAMETA